MLAVKGSARTQGHCSRRMRGVSLQMTPAIQSVIYASHVAVWWDNLFRHLPCSQGMTLGAFYGWLLRFYAEECRQSIGALYFQLQLRDSENLYHSRLLSCSFQ